MIIRVLSISVAALLLAAPAFAVGDIEQLPAPRAQEQIQAPVGAKEVQAPRVAEVNDELYQPAVEPA